MHDLNLSLLLLFLSLSLSHSLSHAPSVAALISCPDTKFLCPTEKQCISKDKLCDGHPDCKDGADEKDACCESRFLIFLSTSFLFHLLTRNAAAAEALVCVCVCLSF